MMERYTIEAFRVVQMRLKNIDVDVMGEVIHRAPAVLTDGPHLVVRLCLSKTAPDI
jgi:hypothetical protein